MSGNLTSNHGAPEFLPAAHFHFLTPAYETFVRPMLGPVWRRMVAEVGRLTVPSAKVVDFGCGPGTVLKQLAKARPDLEVTGVDIDAKMLSIAGRRLPQARLVQASIAAVPLEDQSADLILSSLVFHHLDHDLKHGALQEANRILKPGGVFLLCDFSVPTTKLGRAINYWFGKVETGVKDQSDGELLEIGERASLRLMPQWTHLGCITQFEIRLRSCFKTS